MSEQINIKWPEKLPLPTVEGYTIQPSDAIIRTEMESGLARQRRRFTHAPSRISVRWIMRREQFAIFEAWYYWFAQEGGAWFEVELLGGIGLVAQQARFTRQFQAQLLGRVLWEIRSELEIRERPVLSREALIICLREDAQKLLAAIKDMHIFIHQFLPQQINEIK